MKVIILGLTVLLLNIACAHAPPTLDLSSADTLLVVVDDPRPDRLRRFVYRQSYAGPLAYDQSPVLQRYSQSIADDYGEQVLVEWPLKSLSLHCFVISQPSARKVSALSKDPRVRWLQPFNQFDTQMRPTESALSWEKRLKLPVIGGANGVRVSVIDTGADIGHPDLPTGMLVYQDLVGSVGNGREEKHGTSVLGLLKAKPANSKGLVRGLIPGAQVQHLRGCWEDAGVGRCNTLSLALALDAAIEFAPSVLNLSLTGPKDRLLDELIAELGRKGTIVVSAYDETRASTDRFPSVAPNVLFAAAGNTFAAYGALDNTYSAPGQAMSLSPMGDYSLVTGHSVAAPFLTGVVARLYAKLDSRESTEVLDELQKVSFTLNERL